MNNPTKPTLDVRQFLGGYLRQDDIADEQVVTIVDAWPKQLRGDEQASLLVRFAEFGKPLVLNSTNINELVALFDSIDAADWRGPVGLYVDPNVTYGGKRTGGIRVTHRDNIRNQSVNGEARRRMDYGDAAVSSYNAPNGS